MLHSDPPKARSKWPYVTSRWKKLRLVKLAHCPLCWICEKRGTIIEADTVDHITAIRKGGDPFPDLDGLMSLCAPCHNEKTANVDRWDSATGRRFKGCDASGNPVDPADGWCGMRGDLKARYEAYKSGREWGWLWPNDIARLENMPPIAGGDEYLSPLNMTVLGAREGQEGGAGE